MCSRSFMGAKYSKTKDKVIKRAISTKKRRTSDDQELSENQKDLIRVSWRQCQAGSMVNPGVKIFLHIFRRCPELKKVFRLDHVENDEDLPNDVNFMRHARVFTNVIDLTVRNIDELDMQIAPALITFGRRHFYKHQIGFRPEYTNVFATAMMDFIFESLPPPADKEMTDAWWIVTVYLITKLKQGYQLESMHKGKQRLHWV